MYYLIIKADTNDADYVTSIKHIPASKIEDLRNIIFKVKKESDNSIDWRTGDHAAEEVWEAHPELTVSECELLNDYIPYTEWGIHTIEDVQLFKVESVETLL